MFPVSGMKRGPDFHLTSLEKRKTDANLIQFVQLPSLKQIAAVSVAIQLWIGPKVLNSVKEFASKNDPSNTSDDNFQRIVNTVLKEVRCLRKNLPKELIIEITQVIRPIGLQLFTCFEKDNKYFSTYSLVENGGSMCWTMEGVIDKAKCLETAIDNIHVKKDNLKLFKIACRYCLKENISDLWLKITKPERIILGTEIHKRRGLWLNFTKNFDGHNLNYWTAKKSSHLSCFFKYNTAYESFSPHGNMFLCSIYGGNIFGVKYFWKQLTNEEQQNARTKPWTYFVNRILNTVHLEYQQYNENIDILCFLLDHCIESEVQKEIFQTYSFQLLKALFYSWPFQRQFLPTMKVMSEYLHRVVYIEIMKCIVREIKPGRATNNLFRDVWLFSPLRLRKSYLSDFTKMPEIVWKLLSCYDLKTIDLLLHGLTPEQISEISLNMIKLDYEYYILRISEENKLSYLNDFISKTPSSNVRSFKHDMIFLFGELMFNKLTLMGKFITAKTFLYWGLKRKIKYENFKMAHVNYLKIDVDDIIVSLIQNEDYKNLNQLLKWCFVKEEKMSRVLKVLSKYSSKLLLEFAKCPWSKFETFIRYFSFSVKETIEVKSIFLKHIHLLSVEPNSNFASLFLNWCRNSEGEVKKNL